MWAVGDQGDAARKAPSDSAVLLGRTARAAKLELSAATHLCAVGGSLACENHAAAAAANGDAPIAMAAVYVTFCGGSDLSKLARATDAAASERTSKNGVETRAWCGARHSLL